MKRLGFVLVLVVLFAAGCGADGGADGGATTETAELRLVATDIAYDVSTLTAKANQPVHLSLENAGALDHDFSIREIALRDMHATEGAGDDHMMSEDAHELDLHVAAMPHGGHGVVEFTPTEAGEYEFYCTVPGHKEAGMTGTFVVTP